MAKQRNLSDLIQRTLDKQRKAQEANRKAIAQAQERIARAKGTEPDDGPISIMDLIDTQEDK